MKKILLALTLLLAVPAGATTFTGTNNTPAGTVVKISSQPTIVGLQLQVANMCLMRGVNSLSATVFWLSFGIDATAGQFTGGNTPLTNVVVVKCTLNGLLK